MLLEKHYNQTRNIDFASIDVEGAELKIMRQWPFDDWCVSVFTIENNMWCDSQHSFLPDLKRILGPHGYHYRRRMWVDEIFVKKTPCRPFPHPPTAELEMAALRKQQAAALRESRNGEEGDVRSRVGGASAVPRLFRKRPWWRG